MQGMVRLPRMLDSFVLWKSEAVGKSHEETTDFRPRTQSVYGEFKRSYSLTTQAGFCGTNFEKNASPP